ncbi:oxoglutarate/malate translocator [Pelagophyceae sp. CCMP2097]|nr:oxoglutarate/malate translocator [Pelagophyceae sp. CCMP2097]|mmetsp:Transcript_20918/g.70843  ORF Transcript_20918/g.70843 Transcript_20918/m.70843 type:complete len:304 (-) Transcript_20918:153-1064(-)
MAAATMQPFVVGGVSACIASAVIHPIDLAKVRLQLFATANPGQTPPSFVGLLSGMVKAGGVSSIYAGLDASMMRQASYGTARIGLNRSFSDGLQQRYGAEPLPVLLKVASGMASGALAVCIGTPMDVALVRLQADSMKPEAERRNYAHVGDALMRTAKQEGVGALWKGLAPNICRGMAMNVGQLTVYDVVKEQAMTQFGDEDRKKPSMKSQLTCSAIAGFTAAGFSLPFDLLKSRLQDQRAGADGKMPYAGLADCAAQTMKKEGPLAFWTGFSAYYLRCAPHAMLILLLGEQLKQQYQAHFLK